MEETNLSTDEMMLPPDQMDDSEPTVQILYLVNKLLLVSKVESVVADIGQPDCKLTKPCLFENGELTPWLSDVSDDEVVMMSSDKILTLVEPNQTLLDDYESLTK
tara:strand:- start:439 stop:753 length:315 start_codon:yes stop_codon:yes gene_type:complete